MEIGHIISVDVDSERVFRLKKDDYNFILALLHEKGEELNIQDRASFFRKLNWVRKIGKAQGGSP